MTDDEWPKKWSDIAPDRSDNQFSFVFTHIEYQDGMRGYDGTLYAAVGLGTESDNRDLWLPFDRYIQSVMDDGP